jgi:hypothetical protein
VILTPSTTVSRLGSKRSWSAEWFGRAWLGTRVEWIAGVYPDVDEWAAPNEFGPAAASRLEHANCRRRKLLLSPLDIQLAVNQKRGLIERVDAIRRFNEARD